MKKIKELLLLCEACAQEELCRDDSGKQVMLDGAAALFPSVESNGALAAKSARAGLVRVAEAASLNEDMGEREFGERFVLAMSPLLSHLHVIRLACPEAMEALDQPFVEAGGGDLSDVLGKCIDVVGAVSGCATIGSMPADVDALVIDARIIHSAFCSVDSEFDLGLIGLAGDVHEIHKKYK